MKYLLAIGEANDSEFEFGEFYHLATAILAYPKLNYIFVGNLENPIHLGCYNFIIKFKKPISIMSYEKYKKKRKRKYSIGITADIIKAYYNESVHDNFARIVDENSISPDTILNYIRKLNLNQKEKYAFLWVRNGKYQTNRNITKEGIIQLHNQLIDLKIMPILIGSELETGLTKIPNLQSFFLDPIFKNNPFNQLILFQELINRYHVIFSIGLKSGGMDAPTLAFGLPCIYFGTQKSNKRMQKVCKSIKSFKYIPIKRTPENIFHKFSPRELAIANEFMKYFL